MRRPSVRLLLRAAAFLPLLGGCALVASDTADRDAHRRTLTTIVSELRLHLRDDTYRHDRSRGPDGQNVFAVALWRLERLQRSRPGSAGPPDSTALVIEFARARSLERLRRYAEAQASYEIVAASGSLLAEDAERAAAVMRRFAARSGAPGAAADAKVELAQVERRILEWRGLAFDYRGTSYAPLAREEAEAWSMLRVEWHALQRGPEAAIEPCERLIEEHRESKLYAKHLIRLGDLYAEAVRRRVVRQRARRTRLDTARYEQLLDRALSAYELAEDERRRGTRSEARSKIDALIAYHNGVRPDAH